MLSVGGSRVHSVLVTLLYLLVVVAAVASIPPPLRIGRRAHRSNYADNNRERDKSAAKCLFHISSLRYDFPSVVSKNSATVMPLISFENIEDFKLQKVPIS